MAIESLFNHIKLRESSSLSEKNQFYPENRHHSQEMMKIGTWTYEMGSDTIYFTDEYYHIFEAVPDQMGKDADSYFQYISEKDESKVRNARELAFAGQDQELVYMIVTARGNHKFVREKTRTLLDKSGQPVKIIGAIQDITSEKTFENRLKELGENLNLGQKVAGLGSWKYNAVKKEIFWSDEIYRIFDLKPEEFSGTVIELMDFTYPEDRYILTELTQKRLTHQKFDLQYRIQLRNKSIKFLRLVGEPLLNEDGLNTDLVGTIQDISEIKKLENEIAFIKKNLERAQQLAQIGSWEMDVAKAENFMSAEALRIFGITAAEFKGTFEDFFARVHPEDRDIIIASMAGPLTEDPFELEFRVIRPDETIRDVLQVVEFKLDKNGEMIHVHGTIQDITEKKAYQRALELKQHEIDKIQQRTKMLIQESGVVFEIITATGIISYISDTSQKVINFDAEMMIGKSVYDYYDHDDAVYLRGLIDSAIENKAITETGIISFAGKTETPKYLEVHIQNFLDHPIIQGLVLDFRDVTNRIILQRKIEKLASYDETTALPKPNQFKKELTEKCLKADSQQSSLIVMMLDFEGFKEINDSLGAKVGQLLIIQIVLRLRLLLGKEVLISRYSEDHFAIVIEGLINLEAYHARVVEVIEFFERSFKVDIYEFDINVNVGVSVYPLEKQAHDVDRGADQAHDEIEQLIQYANTALVWSKKEGRNRCRFFSAELNIQNYKQLQLRNDMRLSVKSEQFMVFYQPMVQLSNNQILAVEALIRWSHPDWGIVSPDEFIFLAEETGAIVEIGKWTLKKVCQDYHNWILKGYQPFYISVNFSSIQFYERDFVKNITDVLDEYQIDPKYLIVELTESLIIENAHKAIADIKKLQQAGIKVALDDFGTGYSSLSYLQHFNIDMIKMDVSFLKNVVNDTTTATIAKAIINLTKELHIKLVCEGIENWEQLAFLRENNCYAGQGYLYARPMPFLKTNELLAKGKCRPLLSNATFKPQAERRKSFRQPFRDLLKTDLTILKIRDKKMNVGNSKALIKNIGPGGLCFVSNIQFPLERDFTLKFKTILLGKELSAIGSPVWSQEAEDNLFEYGVKFMMAEDESEELMRTLYELQVKMKKNILFVDGSFTDKTAYQYFDELTGQPNLVKVDFSQYKRSKF